METIEEAAKNYSNYNEQINKAVQEAVKFGAIKHTQYGNPVVKISLVNNPKVKIVK
jgi:hypothetical protein